MAAAYRKRVTAVPQSMPGCFGRTLTARLGHDLDARPRFVAAS
ncbi:hypothetical protein [Terriglobus aquaticus]|uniref:Transposase n=1 Tax=Terriglobus aquaticus TaxID=940139 RepID=A0ABW9KPV4_9BACT|nr:hypothetical protein [Terriglobus aquaticus]